jgi:hypothetical protein
MPQSEVVFPRGPVAAIVTPLQAQRLKSYSLPARVGSPAADVVIGAIVVVHVIETDGTLTTLSPQRIAGLTLALADAAERINHYSNDRYRLRFDLRVVDDPIPLRGVNNGLFWPDPDVAIPAALGEFPAEIDALLVAHPPSGEMRAVSQGLTTFYQSSRGKLLFTTITPPHVALVNGAPIPIATQPRLGDLVMHEFGHMLEQWSRASGHTPAQMHDSLNYGFTPVLRDDHTAWYRFFYAQNDLFLPARVHINEEAEDYE